MTLPVLYSLQHCPYAMRARLAILLSGQLVAIRAIIMKDKPAEMLLASLKGTVPVLVLNINQANETVIDESLDVMLWALKGNDPDDLLYSQHADALPDMLKIIAENDKQFKPSLEKYKRAKRFHDETEEDCRLECEPFIQKLEQRLSKQPFLMGETPSLLDYALLPFVRQFSKVNRRLFVEGPYPCLQPWLSYHLQSQLFSKAMTKYPLWLDTHKDCFLGDVG